MLGKLYIYLLRLKFVMAEKTNRRNFISLLGVGAASAVIFGVGGYLLGSSGREIVERTITQAAATATVTQTRTQTVTAPTTVTTTVMQTVEAKPAPSCYCLAV
jgi:carbohydrate-binding DOMON domain-containing protein